MCSSYGRSERSGSGSHAHVRSLCGNLSGKRACITLTALAYLAVCFFIVPAIFMGFSLAGDASLLVLITLCIITA